MSQLLAIRDAIHNFIHYNRKITYPILRFLLYGVMLWGYMAAFGYRESRMGWALPLLFLILSALLFHESFFYFFVFGLTSVELYAASPELGIVFGLAAVVVYLLYLRYNARLCLIVLAVPAAFLIHVPCLVPLAVGMLYGCTGIVPVTFGVAVWYFAQYYGDYKTVLSSGTLGQASNGVTYVLKFMNQDMNMWLTIAVFALVVILVNYIYHMTWNHAWGMAILAGAVANVLLFLLGDFLFGLDSNVIQIILTTAVSALVTAVAQLYLTAVDFSRVERVEFSDDEYYYYVKAVPKVKVGFRNVSTKKISGSIEEEKKGN